MKKYLMMGAAAMTLCATFTSCSKEKDVYDPALAKQQIIENYNEAFVETFGQPAPDQSWGFGSSSAGSRMTRSITVNGDVYDKFPSTEEVAANFPTAIPEDAVEVADLETKYKGTKVQTEYGEATLWDLYAIYDKVIVEGFNLKITQAGVTELGGSKNNASYDQATNSTIAHPYNVYVNVDGNVTIRRNGSTHFNLYVLQGNVTLEENYGEQAGLISVASGATVTDQRNSIAANQGVKIFNRGTFNATNPSNYDIGNFCTFYNEGKFTATGALTYSPGMANTSYFMNLGDEAEVTAPQMTLNSAGNFFNSGKVNIAGETNVTQKDIYWVNAGHYTTGTIEFSAWNSTFYNYCQLIVKGKAHMFDGQFNLMEDSYTEAGSAEMDNFIVNMGSNTGMYIKGNLRLLGQGDATYQGFRTEGTNDYLLIDGKAIVDCHRYTFSISSGITYSINGIDIVRGEEVVTEQQLQEEQSGDLPVLDIKGTECPYGKLTVTPNTNTCGATWTIDGFEPTPKLRVIAEDLSASEASDFDFNDVVMDVEYVNDSQVKITLQAAGGTLPLRINGDNNWEVHKLFEVSTGTIVNTCKASYYHGAPCAYGLEPVELLLNGTFSNDQDTFNGQVKNIKLEVYKTYNDTEQWIELTARIGEPAKKVGVPTSFLWAEEGKNVNTVFNMTEWVKGAELKPAN
ncbi:MAG: hypothetical protein J6Z14_12730 [Prevotella sp.]|nr:hypothetical protein [Prevotella sp.]